MNTNEERAKRLLKHYFRLTLKAYGLPWDSDNDAEVDDIVDCIIAAVKDILYEEAFGGDTSCVSAGAPVVQPAEAPPGYIYHTNYLR